MALRALNSHPHQLRYRCMGTRRLLVCSVPVRSSTSVASTQSSTGGIVKHQEALVHDLQADLKACSLRRDIVWGRSIHAKVVESGNGSNMYLATALINMYAKCRSMRDAHRVFDSTPKTNVVSWNALLMGYAENGEGLLVLDLFSRMKGLGCVPSSVTYVAVLKACTSLIANGGESKKRECLERGRKIHSEIGDQMDHYVQSTLVDMYAKCGSMVEARRVFDSIENPNVVSWTALLVGYAGNGDGLATLDLFSKMKASGCAPNCMTYIAAVKACTALAVNGDKTGCLERGREIHSEIGSQMDYYLQNALVVMYAKCGSMVEARQVFDTIEKPDIVSWSALLLGYAENGEGRVALDMFSWMKARRIQPDSVTYVAVFKACTSLAVSGDEREKRHWLELGREIHLEIGVHKSDCYLQSTLIDMYAKCGSMVEARQVFDSIEKPDVVSWSALLSGYADNGEGQAVLDLFSRMKAQGCVPNSVTYVAAIKACGLTGALDLGRKIHAEIGEFNAHLVACLVTFYAKCGSMVEAREAFDMHPRAREVSTWSAVLAAYAACGDSDSVFRLFQAMEDGGFKPDAITLLCVLSCCNHAGLVAKAREYLEAMPVRYGIRPTLLHYNSMVDGLGRANQLNEAVHIIRKMPCNPQTETWSALLASCRKWKNVEIGKLAFQSMDNKGASSHDLMAQIYGNPDIQVQEEQVKKQAGMKQVEQGSSVEARSPEKQQLVQKAPAKLKEPDTEKAEQNSPVKAQPAAPREPQGEGNKEEAKLEEAQVQPERRLIRKAKPEQDTPGPKRQRPELLLDSDCGHCEKRAVAYGILKIPEGEPIRVFKDTRMCDDCHAFTKMVTKKTGRTIMVRDSVRFHVMENGACSCKDHDYFQ